MSLTITQKGLVLVLLPLVFQFGFVLLVARLQGGYAAAQAGAAHAKDVVAQAQEVHGVLADAQSAARGFAITGDESFAGPLDGAARELPGLLTRLEELVRDDPGQAARAAAVRAGSTTLLAWLGELARPDRRGDAVTQIRSGRGEQLMGDLRRDIGALVAGVERLDRERAEALEDSRRRLNGLFAAGGVTAAASSLVLAYLFRRGIGRRFAVLTDNTRRLAAGECLPPPLPGDDEIARLDRAFREMAAALTEASDRVRDLYDNAPCGYHSVGPDGTVVAINRTELRWLGYEAGEVIGRVRFVELVSPASRDTYRAAFGRVRERGSVADVEVELARRDGTTFPVLLNSSAVRDPDGRYVRSRTTLTDLTERKRAEDEVRRLNADLERRVAERTAELTAANDHLRAVAAERERAEAAARETAARLRAIVETAVDGIITIDERGAIETVNSSAERMFGYPAAELISRNVNVLMPEPYRGEHDGYLANYLRTGERKIIGYGREVRGRRKDGAVFPVDLAVSETRVGDRRVFTGLVRDITDRKRSEEELRRALLDLAEANRDLVQKHAENEMFVYSVSHDLRSPLVNLQGFSKELDKGSQQLAALLDDETVPPPVRERGRTLLGGKMAKSVGFIQTAVMRLSNIIDALLRLSRAGRVEYRWEEVDVAGVVGRVADSLQGTVAEKGAVVRVGDLPPAWGDRTAVEQVFANLIGNALAYLDPARPGVVEVGCLPPGSPGVPPGFLAYYVRDNGLGIPEAHRGKIFQAFQRAHPGVGSGEGLGLAIVARVAERHRGRVWVESAAGAGSTFFVALPAFPADGRAGATPDPR